MNGDPDLRAQFDRLKQEDALSAPLFSGSWEAARRSAGSPRRPLLRAAAVAAALVPVAIGLFLVQIHPPRQTVTAQVSQWHSPTAFLLRTPGSPLFTSTPRFGEPLIPSFQETRN